MDTEIVDSNCEFHSPLQPQIYPRKTAQTT